MRDERKAFPGYVPGVPVVRRKREMIPWQVRLWRPVDFSDPKGCWPRKGGRTFNTGAAGIGCVSLSRAVHFAVTSQDTDVRRVCETACCCNPAHIIPTLPESRFWAKVDTTPGLGPSGTCWLWKGHYNRKGYGGFESAIGSLAHRYSFWLHNKTIDGNLMVLHSCHNPPCVNPNHLRQGTAQDNMDDCVSVCRQSQGERHSTAGITDEDVRTMRFAYVNSEVSQQELADMYGITRAGVQGIVNGTHRRAAGGCGSSPAHEKLKRGDASPASKVTQEAVSEIRRLYKTGMYTQKTIGGWFGITQAQVSHIVRGVHWST